MNQSFFNLEKEKQDSIINAALKSFAKKGYRNTTTEQITKEAGISKGLLFHYFINKKKLYLYLFEYSVRFVTEKMDDFHYKEERDLFDFILNAMNIKCSMMKEYPYIFEFLLSSYKEEDTAVSESLMKNKKFEIDKTWNDFMKNMDKSKFKNPSVIPELINIITWMSNGFMNYKLMDAPFEVETIRDEFAVSLQILKENFYKEEFIK